MAFLFTMSGRIDRKQFLTLNLALGAALFIVTLLAIGLAATGMAFAPGQPVAAVAAGSVVVAGALVAFLWIGMALVIRRLRDIGLDPWPIAIGLSAFSIADASVAAITETTFFGPFQYNTPLGAAVSVAAWGVMILWPSSKLGDVDPETDDDSSWQATSARVEPLSPAMPTLVMTAVVPGTASPRPVVLQPVARNRDAGAAHASFGRRA